MVTEATITEGYLWQIIFQLGFVVIYLGLQIVPIVMLPIYISVFRSNRERDQAVTVIVMNILNSWPLTAIYPIIQHFYRMIFVLYGSLIFAAIATTIGKIFPEISSTTFSIIAVLRALSAFFIIDLVQTHQALLALLALQRFLLYFFPELEPRITFGMRTSRISIYFLHVLCFGPFLSIPIINYFITPVGSDKLDLEVILKILSIIFNSIFITSAFLYIPIYISIFRLRHLPSIGQYKPQKYILYQTLLAFLFKTTQLIIMTFYTSIVPIGGKYMPAQTELLLTPFFIQLPYLFCNRRNVKSMKKWLSLKYLWSRIGSRNPENRVGIAYIQSTTI